MEDLLEKATQRGRLAASKMGVGPDDVDFAAEMWVEDIIRGTPVGRGDHTALTANFKQGWYETYYKRFEDTEFIASTTGFEVGVGGTSPEAAKSKGKKYAKHLAGLVYDKEEVTDDDEMMMYHAYMTGYYRGRSRMREMTGEQLCVKCHRKKH